MEVAKKDDQPTHKVFLLVSDGEDYGQELNNQLAALSRRGLPRALHRHRRRQPVSIPVLQPGRPRDAAPGRQGPVVKTQFCGSDAAADRRRSPAAGTSDRRPAASCVRAITRIVKGERRLIGWRTTTEYRDLYPAGLAVAGGRRSRTLVPAVTTMTCRDATDVDRRTRGRASSPASNTEIGKVIVGQHVLIRRLLTGLFAAIPFAASKGAARAAAATCCSKACPASRRR